MTLERLPVLEVLDRDRALALGSEWPDLLADSTVRSPFLTWSWLGTWLETLGSSAELQFHVARDATSGRLLGAAPFHVVGARRGGIPVRELRFIGSGRLAADHLDLVVREDVSERIGGVLWDSVERAAAWDVVDLDGAVAGGLLDSLVLQRDTDVRETIPAPYLALDGGWDAVRAKFGRTHRQNIGRYARKLDADAGAPVVERMVAGHADLGRTFDRLVELHQAVRHSKGDPGLFADESVTAFLRTVAHRLLDAGRLRMWRLDVGEQAIAVIWCMRAFDTVAFYTTGFDGEWARYGPGRRIMARAIEAATAEGATEFDFLRGDEDYKRSWGVEVRTDLRLRRPASAKGRAVWMARAVARAVTRGRRDGT